jgi:integrase
MTGRWILQRSRRWPAPFGPPDPAGHERDVRLGVYAREHLARKRRLREASPRWLLCVERHLQEAVRVLGPTIRLDQIGLREVEDYLAHLLERSNDRGGTLSAGTINHYLNSLSNLFRRAATEGLVAENPIRLLLHRPARRGSDIVWLEPPEVADLLDFAKGYSPRRADLATPFLFELVAVFAYTGLRKREVLGLEIGDVSLQRRVILVRPNRWRSLKNPAAVRQVPLFSELAVILERYLAGRKNSATELIFPSPVAQSEQPLTNLRRAFDRFPMPNRLAIPSDTGDRVGSPPPLRTRILRHSYCAARLQTLDWGQPISPYTVARELGHTDLNMVMRVYGHLGKIRLRSAEVSFLGSAMRNPRANEPLPVRAEE